MQPRLAFFLDRDDTLVRDEGYMSRPESIALLPHVAEALQAAKAVGSRLYLVTNQSGIGRGYYRMEDAVACNKRLEELLGIDFDGICIAPEKPGEPSRYRKPSPTYILEKIKEDGLAPECCIAIGDKASDIECGVRAGVRAALVARGATGEVRPDALAFAREHGIPVFSSVADAIFRFLDFFGGTSRAK